MITLPIIVDEHNGIVVFESVDSAARYMEPIDVLNNVYTAYDSQGHLLRLSVKRSGRHQIVEVESAEAEPNHRDELKTILITHFRYIRMEDAWLIKASFEDLVQKASEDITR